MAHVGQERTLGLRSSIARITTPALNALGLATRAQLETVRFDAAVQRRQAREASGVAITFGRYGIEKTPNLIGAKRWETLAEMETDARVKEALRATAMPLVATGEWKFEPASDKTEDKRIADFCDTVLLRKTSDEFDRDLWTETAWQAQRLPEGLNMLRDGFAIWAKRWRAVGKYQVADFHWLEPSSVDPQGWMLSEDDEFLGVKRTYASPNGKYRTLEPLAAKDIHLWVWELHGARFEGRAFIRSMYGSWYRREFYFRMAAILAQRVGAPVPVVSYPSNYDVTQAQAMNDFAESLAGQPDTSAHLAAPYGANGEKVTVDYAGSNFEIDRLGQMIDREGQEIAHAGDTKSKTLGETQSGSRAVGQTQQSTEMLAVQAVAQTICEWETHGPANLDGIVEELVYRNFANARNCPRLNVTGVRPDEAMILEERRLTAWEKGVLPKTPEVRKSIAEGLEFKLPDEAYDVQEMVPVAPVPAPTGGNGEVKPPAPQPVQATLADEIARHKAMPEGSKIIIPDGGRGAKPRGWFRAPTEFEQRFVSLGTIESEVKKFEQRYYAVSSATLRDIGANIVDRVRAGRINAGNFHSLPRSEDGASVLYAARLRKGIENVLRATGKFGVEQVQEEIGKQRAHHRATAAKPGTIQYASDAYETRASIDAGAMLTRLENEVLAFLEQQYSEGLSDREIAANLDLFLQTLSEKPIGALAREAIGKAFNIGRDLELRREAEQIAYVVRTEILDDATCGPCITLDGTLYAVGSDEYMANAPPAKCEGGGRCRGFMVPVIEPDQEAA